ncbi:hypothetical protein [Teredinibacter sp. KSP-S5-2]|uniref:hypothetical protein n=1 Tax=Teredinibacter sp. KSP-S5-2 TaxID=3034506 RepID=UPI002934F2D9|nr:hypothetical protein [Teredinibacter sp. KSP-S5-2]WNO08924.1 hypothetical protein P5V12_18415 [Teredinibacter sp. KSP-S5-2]
MNLYALAKKCVIASGTILIASLTSSLSYAELVGYKFENIRPSYWGAYPGPDLNEVSGAIVYGKMDEQFGFLPETLEIKFPRATDYKVSGFKRQESHPYGLAGSTDAWIYKDVLAEFDDPSFYPRQSKTVRLKVTTNKSTFNDPAMSQGETIFEFSGELSPIYERTLADSVSVTIDNKKVLIDLYQDYRINDGTMGVHPEGFDLRVNWLGHGQKDLLTYTGGSCYVGEGCKAVALKLTTEILPPAMEPEHFYEVEFMDRSGYKQISPRLSLRDLLNENFPPTP